MWDLNSAHLGNCVCVTPPLYASSIVRVSWSDAMLRLFAGNHGRPTEGIARQRPFCIWVCLKIWHIHVLYHVQSVDGCEILHQLIVVYPMICRVSTIKGGAGFLLSTVSQSPKAPLGCGALRSTSDQIWVNFLEFLRLLRCVWDCWD